MKRTILITGIIAIIAIIILIVIGKASARKEIANLYAESREVNLIL